MPLLTVGHGPQDREALGALLTGAGVALLVDVRRFPGSRHNPQYGRPEMEGWLPEAGIDYVWLQGLGGRRRPAEGSEHVALRHKAFRAYADHMESSEFAAALDELLDLAGRRRAAVMCSESLWWRCHRRLLADHLVLVRDVEVLHLMHDGRTSPHPLTDGVRRGDGRVVYDVGVTSALPGVDG